MNNNAQKIQTKMSEAIQHVLRPKENSKILIVNRTCDNIAPLAYTAAKEMGLNPHVIKYSETKAYESFPELEEAIKSGEYPVAMGFFDYSFKPSTSGEERPARVRFLEMINKMSMTYLHSPGITEDMAVNGPLQCDYEEMAKKAKKILNELEGVESLYITAPGGTDLRVGIPEGLKFVTDCILTLPGPYGDPGYWGNLPVGEVCILKREPSGIIEEEHNLEYPVKLDADGTVTCDVCTGVTTKKIEPEHPVELKFLDGVLQTMHCEDDEICEAFEPIQNTVRKYGKPTICEEIGIGLNEKARITGNMLEDEKKNETAHIAFGNIKVHEDVLFKKPTIEVYYKDGFYKTIIKNGKLVV